MRMLIGLMILMAASTAALAQERGHESGRVVEAIYATTGPDGVVATRHLSRELRAKVGARGWPEGDWLRGSLSAAEAGRLGFAVLNTSGGSGDQPAWAAVLVMLNGNDAFGRRFHLIHEDGRWVVRDVCLFPERRALSELIASPEPSGPSRLC